MSLRFQSSWPQLYVSKWNGLGIPGAEVPAAGDNGASPLYNDGLTSTSEYRIVTTTAPSAGTLTVYPDTSFSFTGAPDGTYNWAFTLYEDGVSVGSETVTLAVGATHAAAGGATLTGTSDLSAGSAAGTQNASAPGATLTGTAGLSAGAAQGTSAGIAPGATLTGTSGLQPGSASGGSGVVHGTAPGTTLSGTSSISAGSAGNLTLTDVDIERISSAVWQRVIEAGYTAEQLLRIVASGIAGVSQKTGNTITFKGVDGTTDRIAGSFDAENNRTGAVLDGS